MTLEKKKELRKVEFTFTDGKLNPECHCEYYVVVYENKRAIAREKVREVHPIESSKQLINQADLLKEGLLDDSR